MKEFISKIFILMTLVVVASCVDDLEDANPPLPKDGPQFTLGEWAGDMIESEEEGLILPGGGVSQIAMTVVSAEGLIDSVGVTLSDSVGTASVDQASLAAVRGQKSGTILVNYEAPEVPSAAIEIVAQITLYDGQEPIEWFGRTLEYRKSSTKSADAFTVVCGSTGLAGTYSTLANGFTGDGAGGPNVEYSDLPSTVTFTEVRPGLYNVDDMSFGLYPEGYGDVAPPGNVNLCGTEISDTGDVDQYNDPFTITGTLNPDGTVDIQWQNTWGDRGTVVCTPQ